MKNDLLKKRQVFESWLMDELSKEVFEARLEYDMHPTLDGMIKLYILSEKLSDEEQKQLKNWRNTFRQILGRNKVFLYGAGTCGQFIAKLILDAGEDFTGFCDCRYRDYPNGLFGKPVYPPEYLLENKDKCYVATAVNLMSVRKDMTNFLVKNGFPEEHILPFFYRCGTKKGRQGNNNQYFDFPELYPQDTAFVDGGAYDGQTGLAFAKWCKDKYSKIFAFEPDRVNYRMCCENVKNNGRIEVINAGLGELPGVATFYAGGASGSHIVAEEMAWSYQANVAEEIKIVSLDDFTKDTTIGFIKLDVEGAELDALRGARNTILRDKPFLAVSVYHKPGDVLEIMNYLQELNLGYRFWLRHYDFWSWETVLYASV